MSGKKMVNPSDVPSRCRTWDDKRRVWVAKARWSSAKDAEAATPPAQHAYKCGDHWHAGHSYGRRR